MNPYTMLSSGLGAQEAGALSARLSVWHDAMVTHERRLRAGTTNDACARLCRVPSLYGSLTGCRCQSSQECVAGAASCKVQSTPRRRRVHCDHRGERRRHLQAQSVRRSSLCHHQPGRRADPAELRASAARSIAPRNGSHRVRQPRIDSRSLPLPRYLRELRFRHRSGGAIRWSELTALLQDCCEAANLPPIERALAQNALDWLTTVGVDPPPGPSHGSAPRGGSACRAPCEIGWDFPAETRRPPAHILIQGSVRIRCGAIAERHRPRVYCDAAPIRASSLPAFRAFTSHQPSSAEKCDSEPGRPR